jgi:S-adenosylmethionine:tRNA ribosyltransferase-isomerase
VEVTSAPEVEQGVHRSGDAFDARLLEYELPPERIAQAPLEDREASRLLCMPRGGGDIAHRYVRDLCALIPPSLIVLNDTRVLPARILGHKPTGGRVELLLVERISHAGTAERWLALARGKGLREGTRVAFGDEGSLRAELGPRRGAHVEVELAAEGGVAEALRAVGEVPLPPYIRRAPDASDTARYQTVYAAHDGAVAAPTAGLHLSERLLGALEASDHRVARVTLHVGPGTFAPLRSSDLAQHVMHPERYVIPESTVKAVERAREESRPVLAVGTTVVRALEAAVAQDGTLRAGAGTTALFIYPPYRFRVVDALLTNFHLPRSTLLALVMAFAGIEPVRRAYREAVEAQYRFYSYGDAMLLTGRS